MAMMSDNAGAGGDIDVRALNRVITRLESKEYRDRMNANFDQIGAAFKDEIVAGWKERGIRGANLGASILRHYAAEFITEHYTTSDLAASLVLTLSGLFYAQRDIENLQTMGGGLMAVDPILSKLLMHMATHGKMPSLQDILG